MDRNKIIKFIRDEFETGTIRHNMFPMMTKSGIRDYSETVHSLGLNYITAIGRCMEGVAAVSEYPVYSQDESCCDSQLAAETSRGYDGAIAIDADIRPDSVWFSKIDNNPLLICEFERYEKSKYKNNKLKEKIANLLISYHQLGGKVPVILFVYWSYSSVTPGDISEYISILDNGFYMPNKKLIPGIDGTKTSYIVYHCIASGSKDKMLFLNQWIKVR